MSSSLIPDCVMLDNLSEGSAETLDNDDVEISDGVENDADPFRADKRAAVAKFVAGNRALYRRTTIGGWGLTALVNPNPKYQPALREYLKNKSSGNRDRALIEALNRNHLKWVISTAGMSVEMEPFTYNDKIEDFAEQHRDWLITNLIFSGIVIREGGTRAEQEQHVINVWSTRNSEGWMPNIPLR